MKEPTAGLTLTEYASAKGLPWEFLLEVGLSDGHFAKRNAVVIPYKDRHGIDVAVRYRTAMAGEDRFRWKRGCHPCLYGLDRIGLALSAGRVHLVEGESDCHALWHAGFPALGVPGVSTWKDEWAEEFEGIGEILVWVEPDSAGANLALSLKRSPLAGRLRFLLPAKLGPWKDASAIFKSDQESFAARVEELVERSITPGAALGERLEEVVEFVSRYVAFPSKHEAIVVALWIAHCFLIEQAEFSPYLSVTSAEKRCGKTTLLDVLAVLVPKPWAVIRPSEAVVYRMIERDMPTLLLDEVDAIFGAANKGDNEGLRALLNAGNRRGTVVPRVKDKAGDLVNFRIFCPKVLAGIGELPETVADRAIPIRLKRRKPEERVEKCRRKRVEPEAEEVRQRLAEELLGVLVPEDVEVPDELGDRAADSWETLLSIADFAGGDWPRRGREAALALSAGADAEAASFGVRLLEDVRRVFGEKGREPIGTRELLVELKLDEEAPWEKFGRDGLDARGLARLLKPYGIGPVNVRAGRPVSKGYRPEDFDDAFSRYLKSPFVSTESATSATSVPASASIEDEVAGVAPVAPLKEANETGEEAAMADWEV